MIGGIREDLNHKRAFESQVAATQRTAQRVSQEIQQLRPQCQDDESPEMKKLLFMEAQAKCSCDIIRMLLAQKGAWEMDEFMNSPSVEEQRKRNRFYHGATELLVRIEASFSRVLQVEIGCFEAALSSLNELIQKYSSVWYAAMGGGAAAGAFILSGGHKIFWAKGIFNLGLRAWGTATFGEAGAVVVGTACGALVGCLLAGAVVYALNAVYGQRNRGVQNQDLVQARHAFEAKMDELKTLEMTEEAIEELLDMYETCFFRVMGPAVASDTCGICLGHFPADGGRDHERPTKTRQCAGNHIFHKECLGKWARTSRDMRCPVCRV